MNDMQATSHPLTEMPPLSGQTAHMHPVEQSYMGIHSSAHDATSTEVYPSGRSVPAIGRDAHPGGQNVHPAERLVSTLLGGALVVYGLAQPSLRGAAASLLGGGMLVHRGMTGHCQLYSALGMNTNHPVR